MIKRDKIKRKFELTGCVFLSYKLNSVAVRISYIIWSWKYVVLYRCQGPKRLWLNDSCTYKLLRRNEQRSKGYFIEKFNTGKVRFISKRFGQMQNYSMCSSTNEFKHFPHFCTKKGSPFCRHQENSHSIYWYTSKKYCQNRVFFSITLLFYILITNSVNIFTLSLWLQLE